MAGHELDRWTLRVSPDRVPDTSPYGKPMTNQFGNRADINFAPLNGPSLDKRIGIQNPLPPPNGYHHRQP
jgi:hypothetical protein